MVGKPTTFAPVARLSVEARRQIASDIDVARGAGMSAVDDATLEALGLESPDGWMVRLKGVPRATDV